MGIFTSGHVRLPLMNWNSVTPRPEARNAPTTRELDCPFCGQALRVPARAINTRCTDCHKHLRLEDIVVRGDSPLTRISTCGGILIEPNARFAGVLQASHIVVAGRVMGTVIGTRVVEVTGTGKVAGTIATRELKADPHALMDGEINILNPDGTVTRVTTGVDGDPPKYRPGE